MISHEEFRPDVHVSIAMATFNGEPYLREQLASFAIQTRLPDELVISDDGSTDATISIIEEFSQSAPFRVVLLRNERQPGISSNFSKSLGRSSGELVFLSDQDDVWFPQKIETILKFVEARPDHLAYLNDALVVDQNLSAQGNVTRIRQILGAGMGLDDFVMGCCTAVRRDLLDLALPIPAQLGHDFWLVEISRRLHGKAILREPLQYWRRHSSNSSSTLTSSARRLDLFTHLYRESRRFMARDLTDESTRELIRSYRIAQRHASDMAAVRQTQREKLSQIENSFRKDAEDLESRLKARRIRGFSRFLEVGALWRRGLYSGAQGKLGLIRDLSGR